MSKIHCFTSVSLSYLHRARVLASTLKQYHPDWTLWLCLVDEAPSGMDIRALVEPFDRLLELKDFDIDNLRSWCFKHNVVELCTAVKGHALCHILEAGAEQVIYLDPDIVLFGSLEPVTEALEESSIVLTPHLLRPEVTKNDVWDKEVSALRHGVYNLGFLGVKNDEHGRAFGAWWRTRLSWYSFEMASEGVYTDQRWCDLVPVFFENVGILRDPGLNVASWNLRHRHVEFDRAGHLVVNGFPLRFFHFTKVDHVGELEILRNIERSAAVLHLMQWYKKELEDNKVEGLPAKWWHYGVYSDGRPIDYLHRAVYRTRADVQIAFPDPFKSGTFDLWMAQHPEASPFPRGLAYEV